jgi:hypothetical protein
MKISAALAILINNELSEFDQRNQILTMGDLQ